MACIPYMTEKQLTDLQKRVKISQLGTKCAENRQAVKDITQRLIQAGALDKTKPIILSDGFYGIIYEFR